MVRNYTPILTAIHHKLDILTQVLQQRNEGYKNLTPFTSLLPGDWKSWKDHFNIVADINQWNDSRKRQEAAAAMEGDAKKLVCDIKYHEAPNIHILMNQYEQRFFPSAYSDVARIRLLSAKQSYQESLRKWHSRIRDLFLDAFPDAIPDHSQLLVDQFLLGLYNHQLMERAWNFHDSKFSEVLDKVLRKSVSLRLPRTKATNPLHNVLSVRPICWICQKKGHIHQTCRTLRKPLVTSNTLL